MCLIPGSLIIGPEACLILGIRTQSQQPSHKSSTSPPAKPHGLSGHPQKPHSNFPKTPQHFPESLEHGLSSCRTQNFTVRSKRRRALLQAAPLHRCKSRASESVDYHHADLKTITVESIKQRAFERGLSSCRPQNNHR